MSAAADRLIDDARRAVHLITSAPSPPLDQLSIALDRVAASFGDVAVDGYPEVSSPDLPPPERKMLSIRFPQLGLYSTTDPRKLDVTPEIADAIDDLVDIVGDLSVAIAIASTAGSDEAARHLRLLADHWLTHLRRLNLLLHVLHYDRW